MLSKQDLQKINTILSTKADKADLQELKEEFSVMRETLNAVLNGIDKLLKRFDDLFHEYVGLKHSDDRQNGQIQELADHTNYKFKN
jgi:predicted nuclease with TOPRIM domain